MWSQEGLYFNVKHGYLGKLVIHQLAPAAFIQRCVYPDVCVLAEAIVRGHKAGLFSAAEYNNLCQCESLEDIKLHLVRHMAGIAKPASSQLYSVQV